LSDWLGAYWDAARSGRVAVCDSLMAQLSHLVEERECGRWEYDTAGAERRLGFIEGCVRLTKAPFYGQPMRPLLWQKAFVEALYSFKHRTGERRGLDRFTKALLLCARKNAKSEFSSALALAEFITGPPGEDIVAFSNDYDQSAIVYDAVDAMRLMIDPASLDTKRNLRGLENRATGTRVRKLSARTRGKEGRNIGFAVGDEVHEMRDNGIVAPVEQSMSLKPNPKLILITTEGFTNDGFLDGELMYARKVIAREAGDEAADSYLPWLYEQDCEAEVWQDEASWEKSNPSLVAIKPKAALRRALARARESKAERAFVLAKDFNIKQATGAAWLEEADYGYDAAFCAEDLRGALCLGAADLAETTDLSCAMAMAMLPGDDTKYVMAHYFIPEAKLEKSADAEAGARYRDWAEAGHMTITRGNDVDTAVVADWFYSLHAQLGMRPMMVGYDQRFARPFKERLDELGIEHEMVNQSSDTMSNAVRLVEAELQARRINTNNCPVTRWCLSNAAIKLNNQMQALIVKPAGRAAHRIDGAVCLAILLEVFRRYRSEFMRGAG
jgi:phage terminase large subunit-like protein